MTLATNRPKAGPKTNQPRAQRPATTPEGRENQLIALAYDVAEQQLRDGTASAMVITHWLKVGSTKNRLEEEKLRKEIFLRSAQTDALKSQKNVEKLYEEALKAMRSYQGEPEDEDL